MLIFRFLVGGGAFFQGLLALWLLAAEAVRPGIPYYPRDPAVLEALPNLRAPARLAATYGLFRGDLWADYALTLAAGVIAELQDATLAAGSSSPEAGSSSIKEARDAARRAARLSPHDARVWLILAAVASRADAFNGEVAEALKMSFYTGPSESVLMPLRLRLSTESNLIENEELRGLAAQDIHAIATRGPELKSALAAVYRTASPSGKRFIEGTLGEFDQSMLRTLNPEAH